MSNVEFHFDFGSPNAYLSHLVIPAIERLEPAPCSNTCRGLLGGVFKLTGNRSPRRSSRPGSRTNPTMKSSRRGDLSSATGSPNSVQIPFFPVNTLAIMRGAVAARKLGVFERYVDEIYRHMWSDPKKLDDPAVLRAALVESGFDAERVLELAQTQTVKDELLANTQRSVDRGAFGSPTFFVGNEIFFGKDRLRDVEEAVRGDRMSGTF